MSITKAILGLTAITFATTFIAGSLLSASDRVEASDAVTATRPLPVFERVTLNGAFTTTVTAGSAQHVKLTASRATLARITTTVTGGTLTIDLENGSQQTGPVRIDIALANLRGFSHNGAGNATISGIHDDVAIANHGAATITASGHANVATISLDGVGKIDASELHARDVTASNDGVGSVSVRGTRNLTLAVNGVGEIRYAGSPAHVDPSVNGIGRISALENHASADDLPGPPI